MAAAGDFVFDSLDERLADPLPSKSRIDEDRKERRAIAIDAGSSETSASPSPRIDVPSRAPMAIGCTSRSSPSARCRGAGSRSRR